MLKREDSYLSLIPTTAAAAADRKRIRRISVAFLFIVGSFFEGFTFFALKFRIFRCLHESYDWDENDINEINANVTIFLIYMSLLGGFSADFLCSKYFLVFVDYSVLFIGSVSYSLLHWNAHHNGTGVLGPICPYNETLIEKKTKSCARFSTTILFAIGFGNGVLLPILYSAGCSQIKSYGSRIVSIFLFVSYANRNFAELVSRLIIPSLSEMNNHSFFILLGFSYVTSSILLITALKLRDQHDEKIPFYSFVDIFRKLILTIWRNRRPLQRRPNIFPELDDHQSDLREGVKRLMCNVLLCTLLILPACVLISMMSLANKQTLYMSIPACVWKLSSDFNVNLLVNNFNILGEFSLIISSMIIVYLTMRFYSPHQVMSYQKRFIVGTGLALFATYYNGIIESIRLIVFWGAGNPTVKHSAQVHSYLRDHKTYYAANMSLFYLCPSFIALGLGEILVSVTAFEYSYLHSPPWLRYTAIGFAELSYGTGSFSGRPFVHGLDGILYNGSDINYRQPSSYNSSDFYDSPYCWESRLDIVYYITASLMLASFLLILFGIRAMLSDFFHISSWDNRPSESFIENNDHTPPQSIQNCYSSLDYTPNSDSNISQNSS